MVSIAVIDPGGSHNLNVLLQAHREQSLKEGLLNLVITDHERATAYAQAYDIPVLSLAAPGAGTLTAALADHAPVDLIVMLGWPATVEQELLNTFTRRIMRLHPALPGQFPGEGAVQKAFDAYHKGRIKWSGCNLHYINADNRAGKVIRQIVVPVEPRDTIERFQERMRKSEAWVLLKGIKQYLYEQRNQKRRSPRRK